ncbi:MAG: metallophosphoesterase [Clostridia bacterium]|nr:metallophosphoesterase [Clostridia bacterium]
MKFLIIPLSLIMMAYASRFVYKVIMCFFDVPKKKKIIVSVAGAITLFAICMFVGGVLLAVAAHMLIFFLMADVLLQVFKIPFFKKYDPTSFRYFKAVFSAGLFLFAIAMTVWGSFNASDIQIKKYSVSFEGKDYDATKVLFVSDIHAGDSNTERICRKLKDTCNTEKPQLVIIGGDIADSSTSLENLNLFADVFSQISKNIPVLFVCGNHDIMGGDGYGAETIIRTLTSHGVIVLTDEVFEFNGIDFVGRNEYYSPEDDSRRKSIQILAPNVKTKATVVIDHQPKELEKLGEIGVDMSLSGHTHNGQIFPIGYVCSLLGINEMQYGIKRFGSNTAIVSSGAGTWGMDVRTQGHSEFVIVEIK